MLNSHHPWMSCICLNVLINGDTRACVASSSNYVSPAGLQRHLVGAANWTVDSRVHLQRYLIIDFNKVIRQLIPYLGIDLDMVIALPSPCIAYVGYHQGRTASRNIPMDGLYQCSACYCKNGGKAATEPVSFHHHMGMYNTLWGPLCWWQYNSMVARANHVCNFIPPLTEDHS